MGREMCCLILSLGVVTVSPLILWETQVLQCFQVGENHNKFVYINRLEKSVLNIEQRICAFLQGLPQMSVPPLKPTSSVKQ